MISNHATIYKIDLNFGFIKELSTVQADSPEVTAWCPPAASLSFSAQRVARAVSMPMVPDYAAPTDQGLTRVHRPAAAYASACSSQQPQSVLVIVPPCACVCWE